AAGGCWRLLILRRKKHRPHGLLEPLELLGGFMGRMKKVAPFTDMGAAITEIVGGGGLCDGGQVQDFEASPHFQEMANEVVDVDSLHHDDGSGGLFIVCSGRQGVAVPFDHA